MAEPTAGNEQPYFEFHVFVCVNRRPDDHPKGSCAVRGSEQLRDYMKRRAKQLGLVRARINSAGCLDRCALGPCIVIYPQGIWYRVKNEQDVDQVLQAHLVQGRHATSLMLAGG